MHDHDRHDPSYQVSASLTFPRTIERSTTNFEVLRRQDELEQARLRQAAAVADYRSARADLDGLSGAILARYGIVMP